MTVTAQQVLELALDLVEERLDSGSISPSDTISYKVRTPGILTMLQSELIKQGDIFSTYEIVSNGLIEPLSKRSSIKSNANSSTCCAVTI